MKQIDLTNYKKDRKSPFKVPDGYFENFTSQMMEKIPETNFGLNEAPACDVDASEEKVTLFTRIKPYLYLAATICGLAFGVKVYYYQQQFLVDKNEVPVTAITEEQATQYVDEVCDFMMVDDHDVYACATNTSY